MPIATALQSILVLRTIQAFWTSSAPAAQYHVHVAAVLCINSIGVSCLLFWLAMTECGLKHPESVVVILRLYRFH